ncbi:hypothetical protein KEM52_005579 [Ascosphaera acerosa]|nr:hypothetical protein KEM52_005579 [Ascosphaera acerosa]
MAEGTTAAFRHEFKVETWTLFGIGVSLTLLRVGHELYRFGTKIQYDDWLIITALPWYTILCVAINKIIQGGGSNYFPDSDKVHDLTPEDVRHREIGSKWVMVNEQSMIWCVWTCKFCMLLMYKRLTQGVSRKTLMIKAVMAYAGLGFIASQIAFFAECRPLRGYWAVPAPAYECWAYFSFQVVVGVFNITSDIIVLCVAIPLFLRLYLPIQQKIALTAVFGMGVFVIAASILNKVFSLAPKLMNYTYLSWYYREASVALYVVNLPNLWVMLRRLFPSVRLWGYRSRNSNKDSSSALRMSGFGGNASREDTEHLKVHQEFRRWDCEDGLSSTSPICSVETTIHVGKV